MKANVSKLKGKKQGGFIMTTELVLLVTTMVVGMIVGMVSMRDAVNAEMHDVAEAIGALDQSYAFDGIKNDQNTAELDGSEFNDAVDITSGDNTDFIFVASDAEGVGVTANTLVGSNPDAAGFQ